MSMVTMVCGACGGDGVLPDLDGLNHACLNCAGDGGCIRVTEAEAVIEERYGYYMRAITHD